MKRIMIAILLAGISFSAQAAEGKYLEAEEGFYTEILGDGYEEGVRITLEEVYIRIDSLDNVPKPEVVIKNNAAACEPSEVSVDRVEEVWELNGKKYYAVAYTIEVMTSVEGDTGGCLIMLEWAEEEAVTKIVDYTYITDY